MSIRKHRRKSGSSNSSITVPLAQEHGMLPGLILLLGDVSIWGRTRGPNLVLNIGMLLNGGKVWIWPVLLMLHWEWGRKLLLHFDVLTVLRREEVVSLHESLLVGILLRLLKEGTLLLEWLLVQHHLI